MAARFPLGGGGSSSYMHNYQLQGRYMPAHHNVMVRYTPYQTPYCLQGVLYTLCVCLNLCCCRLDTPLWGVTASAPLTLARQRSNRAEWVTWPRRGWERCQPGPQKHRKCVYSTLSKPYLRLMCFLNVECLQEEETTWRQDPLWKG